MAIYVKNKSLEYRPEANCHLSIENNVSKFRLSSVDKIN